MPPLALIPSPLVGRGLGEGSFFIFPIRFRKIYFPAAGVGGRRPART